MKIKIKFGSSSSQNYKKAINLSKKFDKFTPSSDNNAFNQITIEMEELRTKFKYIEQLYQIIQSWKASEFSINDKPTEINDIKKLFEVIKCAYEYSNSVIPEDYCKKGQKWLGWGCKFLGTIKRDLESFYYLGGRYKYWFHFGNFSNPTTWVIDKSRIKEALKKESEINNLILCPKFNLDDSYKILDSLPDSIDLNETSNWKIQYEENIDGQVIEKKPIGIIPSRFENEDNISINIANITKQQNDIKLKNRFIPDIKFTDIGGIEDIIEKIREIIELPLKKPDLFKYLGIKPHKGILLYGPPGCGKTLIAKAIANEVNAHFISIKGPELLSKYHGQSEENFRSIFDQGRALAPSIIFFDEIDSIAQKRSGEENLRIDARIVNQLLTLMDGVEDYEDLCIIASTNRPELIDDALLRPGRFDYILEIKRPTKQGCYKIFSIHTQNMPISKNFNSIKFAEKLDGLSGAEISYVAREGAYNCLRRQANIKELLETTVNQIDYYNFIIVEEDFIKALNSINKGI